MRLIKVTSRLGRDFWGDLECEFCKHPQKLNSGYDDNYFHQNVIPGMKCEACGKTGTEFKEQQEQEIIEELKETAHYYGGWDKLREVIKQLEDNDNEAAYDRFVNDGENY